MFQKSAAVLLAPAIRNAMQRRCQSVISSPPTQKVSSAVSHNFFSSTKIFICQVRGYVNIPLASILLKDDENKNGLYFLLQEKLVLGGGMFVSTLIIPAWVLYHIREYRGLK